MSRGVVWCVVVCCGVLKCGVARRGKAWQGVARRGKHDEHCPFHHWTVGMTNVDRDGRRPLPPSRTPTHLPPIHPHLLQSCRNFLCFWRSQHFPKSFRREPRRRSFCFFRCTSSSPSTPSFWPFFWGVGVVPKWVLWMFMSAVCSWMGDSFDGEVIEM